MSNRTIPSFTSIKEEAEFWDTHEITDYLDEFKIIDGVFLADKGEKKTVMTIRIAQRLNRKWRKSLTVMTFLFLLWCECGL